MQQQTSQQKKQGADHFHSVGGGKKEKEKAFSFFSFYYTFTTNIKDAHISGNVKQAEHPYGDQMLMCAPICFGVLFIKACYQKTSNSLSLNLIPSGAKICHNLGEKKKSSIMRCYSSLSSPFQQKERKDFCLNRGFSGEKLCGCVCSTDVLSALKKL